MKAIVNSVLVASTPTWEGHGKVFYIFDILIGEHAGQYMSPKFTDMNAEDFPFKAGQEAEYEWDAEKKKIKLPQKEFNPGGGGKGNFGSSESFAMSYAKDTLNASWMSPKAEVLALSTTQMFDLADKMYDWMEKKKKQ